MWTKDMKLHPLDRNDQIIKLLNISLHHHASVMHTPVHALETMRQLQITDTKLHHEFANQIYTVHLNYITSKNKKMSK